MRAAIAVLSVLALTACVQRDGPSRPHSDASACMRTETHDVAWSDQSAADTVSARAEGPTCAQAVVTFVVRDAAGDPLWTFSNTYFDLHTGGVPPPGVNPPAVSNEDMDHFLTSFVDVTQMRSGQLPDWAEGAAGPADPSRPFHYSTAFSRDIYEAIRSSDRPLICYAAAADATQCLVIDPASNSPAVLVAFGP